MEYEESSLAANPDTINVIEGLYFSAVRYFINRLSINDLIYCLND